MEQVADPNFLCIVSENGAYTLLNLALVRMITDIGEGEVTLHFSELHTVKLHGSGANELVRTLMLRTVLTNGEPAAPIIEKAIRSRSPV